MIYYCLLFIFTHLSHIHYTRSRITQRVIVQTGTTTWGRLERWKLKSAQMYDPQRPPTTGGMQYVTPLEIFIYHFPPPQQSVTNNYSTVVTQSFFVCLRLFVHFKLILLDCLTISDRLAADGIKLITLFCTIIANLSTNDVILFYSTVSIEYTYVTHYACSI